MSADHAATAKAFHEAYERLAPSFGYETRKESAVPWEQVPEQNRALMTAVCAEVVGALVAERDDALAHVHENTPTRERMWLYHSRLPAEWFESEHVKNRGHFLYKQGPEACYICTAIGAAEAAEAQVDALREALEQLLTVAQLDEPWGSSEIRRKHYRHLLSNARAALARVTPTEPQHHASTPNKEKVASDG